VICRNGDLVKLGRAIRHLDSCPSGGSYKGRHILEDSKSRAVVERRRMGLPAAPSSPLTMTDKGELVDIPEVDLVGINPRRNTAGEPTRRHRVRTWWFDGGKACRGRGGADADATAELCAAPCGPGERALGQEAESASFTC